MKGLAFFPRIDTKNPDKCSAWPPPPAFSPGLDGSARRLPESPCRFCVALDVPNAPPPLRLPLRRGQPGGCRPACGCLSAGGTRSASSSPWPNSDWPGDQIAIPRHPARPAAPGADFFALCEFVSGYHQSPLGETILQALPAGLKRPPPRRPRRNARRPKAPPAQAQPELTPSSAWPSGGQLPKRAFSPGCCTALPAAARPRSIFALSNGFSWRRRPWSWFPRST